MPVFEIPCTWQMSGTYRIEANNLREAIQKVEGDLPLPAERDYVFDSFMTDPIDNVFESNNMDVPVLREADILEELKKRTDVRIHEACIFNPDTAEYSIDELIGILRDYYDANPTEL